ncbi:BQ5605_C007g04368 [Microbotryum silenes-dioicae]|uniref:BQ5605_C007g04368 protein n=1 Tax=Microbotryum silenes-dioicae TaxID=796604 RepID=A0A2X0P2H8_9BASI|nr:BQ5605_C007g04368 [Microbotryum silenes-dioicae]
MQTIREKLANGLEPIRPSRRRSNMEIARICLSYGMNFMFGISAAAIGSNIPSISAQYHVSFALLSTVFLTNRVGFFLACVLSSYLMHNFSVRATLMCGNAFWVMSCLILLLQPSFALVVLAFTGMGAGTGLTEPAIVTVITREQSPVLTSCLYSSFAFGAIFSPLINGSFADRNILWTNFFYIPLGLCVLLSIANVFIFRTYEADLLKAEQEELRRRTVVNFAIRYPTRPETEGQDRRKSLFLSTSAVKNTHPEAREDGLTSEATHSSSTSSKPNATALLLRVLRHKVTWIGFALIVLTMSEGETLGGWSTTYFLQVKHAPAGMSRYISSGKWTGNAIGRILLPIIFLRLLGEKTFAIVILLIACGMQLIVALLPSWKASAIASAFFGFVIGPITPHVLSMVGSRVPSDLMAPAMSLMLANGVVGGAFGPMLFGIVGASKGHLNALPFVAIGLLGLSALGWLFVPRKKEEGVMAVGGDFQ